MIGLILSTYNGKKYVVQQLESIRKQKLKIDHVIIKDDCSTDDTPSIVLKYISDNKLDWKFIENETNLGWEKNFLSGLSLLNDDYVFFCDQDDIWEFEKTEKIIDAFSKSDAEVITTNYKLFYSDKNASKVLEKENKKQINDNRLVNISLCPKNFYIRKPGCTMCLKKEIIAKASDYMRLSYPHDAIFWKLSLLNRKLYNLNIPLIRWRRHDNNASTNKKHTLSKRRIEVKKELDFANILVKQYNLKLVNQYFDFVKLRFYFLNHKNFFCWIKLFKYRNYYVSFKSYLGDLYLWLRNK